MKINGAAILSLSTHTQEDPLLRRQLQRTLQSFVEYHNAIYAMETWLLLKPSSYMDGAEYRFLYEEMDKRRTATHDAAIDNVIVLNRMALAAEHTLIYPEPVSRERPFRRYLADAVLDYVQDIVAHRM